MYRREAGFELRSQLSAVQLAADQHQLVRPRPLPSALVQGETLRHQVKDVPLVALVDPQQALAAIDGLGKPIEKILKPVDRNGRSLWKDSDSKPSVVTWSCACRCGAA